MTRSSKHYRAPCASRTNHLPVIFNTARLRSASSRVRQLALTVLRAYVHCLLLLLAVRSCVQLIGHTAVAVTTLATDSNQSNLSLASDQSPDECPLTEVIDNCLSSLFGKWTWHGPGDCDVDCPQVAGNASDGHLNTCLIEVPLQDTLQNQTVRGSVSPEGTSGQWQLPLSVESYSTAFKTIFHAITFLIDFILWHATMVTFNTFAHMSLILYEFGPPLWTMNRETWRKLKKTASTSGKSGHCRKMRVFLCMYLCGLSTQCLCRAVLKRFKHEVLSKRICRQLVKLPSLLGRGVRCGQKIHGHSLTSFTVQKSFVKRIRSRPSTFCHAFQRHAACIGMWLSEAVIKPYVFLRGLLLLAGDVEQNPGPTQAEEVLKEYRDRFIADIDANAVVNEFLYKGIISEGVQRNVSKTDCPKQQNTILHVCLLTTCTNEALMTACGIIASVQGNPRMSALGKDMQGRLESVEGRGGRGGGQVESFFGRLRNFYRNMKVVEDEWLPADQSLQYVNLALAPFKLGHRRTHEMFVDAVKEGVDNVYTDRSGKIECEQIPKLVKKRKLVVISGAPGVGKSTIARKVCKDICQSPDCCGYILVLLVELRDLLLFKKDFQLVDILQLFQGYMGDTTTPIELSKAITSNQGKNMLFILDGFDELPVNLRQSDFLVNILSHNRDSPLRDCDVVLTSRSIVTSEIYHQMHHSRAQVLLTNVEVLGFTQDQVKEYAEHYFAGQGRPDLLNSFVSKVGAIPQIRGLCSIPVVLSIICQVFSFREDLPSTLTHIYNEYMCIKVLKYSVDLTSLDSILDLPKDHDIYKLGEIAFHCIHSQKMVFESSDFQGLTELFLNRARGCGVLTARPVRADPKCKKAAIQSFYFIHLTVQEFIAALHVSLLPADVQRDLWAKHLGKPHMAQVWRFYCGITQLKEYELLEDNITVYSKDFQMQCLFESQDASLVQRLMPSLVGEKVRVEPKTAYDSAAYGYCLSKHSALQKLTIQIWEGAGSTEIHRLLEPVCASGMLQTLCLLDGNPEDWKQVEDPEDWKQVEDPEDWKQVEDPEDWNQVEDPEDWKQVEDPEDWKQVEDFFESIRNCDSTMKGHFGKVKLEYPPLSVAVKVLCLQHVREVECVVIQRYTAMDNEVLKEMEKALAKNKTLEKLTLDVGKTLPKEFCRHLLFGARKNTSLSEMDLTFYLNWDCPDDVPEDIHGSVQRVTLRHVPVDVLPKLLIWFSHVKHLECQVICAPREHGLTEDNVQFTEVMQALSGMCSLEKLVLGIGYDWSESLVMRFGTSVLKGISTSRHITEFVLYEWSMRDTVLGSLVTDEQRRFTTGRYTVHYGSFPCICLSSSIVGLEQEVDPTPQIYPPLQLQDTQACDGTSQDGTDEGGIKGDGGAGSKHDITDGDDTNDRACTSAEGQEDYSDHAPSPSQSTDPLSGLEGMRRPATELTTLPPAHEDTSTLRRRHGPHHTTLPPPYIGHAHTDTPTSSSLYCSMLTLTVATFVTLCLLLVIMTLLYVV